MQVFRTAGELQQHQHFLKNNGKSLGLVPTMGALHEAHLSLAKRALNENDEVAVSIFVNPTQFNNPEDLEKYPRDLDRDVALLAEAGVQIVFAPSVEEVYGNKVESDPIDLAGLDEGMEGTHRPGHFAGVATIIKRLFEMVRPNRAYFGKKDFQQLRVIEHLTASLGLPTEVVGCDTERDAYGLALSSRNFRLSEAGLVQARAIHRAFEWAKNNYQHYEPTALKNKVAQQINEAGLECEYVEIADLKALKPVQNYQAVNEARIFAAAFCEGVRLIDNDQLF